MSVSPNIMISRNHCNYLWSLSCISHFFSRLFKSPPLTKIRIIFKGSHLYFMPYSASYQNKKRLIIYTQTFSQLGNNPKNLKPILTKNPIKVKLATTSQHQDKWANLSWVYPTGPKLKSFFLMKLSKLNWKRKIEFSR